MPIFRSLVITKLHILLLYVLKYRTTCPGAYDSLKTNPWQLSMLDKYGPMNKMKW
jgi:hypothetical protein